jgi:hypothetical protein
MTAAEDLYRQALALPEDERRELVERIAATLSPGAFTPEELATFAADARAMADGSDTGVTWAELRAQIAGDRAGPTGS